ncbi:MAG TPA: hypothetical protein VGC76_12290 [Pyrinomonadaceae bacterium]|jgi:hypothetical protein
MELNKLSFQVIEGERNSLTGLCFELLIDGESIEKFIGEDKAIPYYLFEEDEVDLPAFLDYEKKKYHVIGVCICGDAGCGSTDCEIEKDENVVDLQVIFRGGYQPPEDIKFRFSRENYDAVIGEIKHRAKEYKEAGEIR